jgi:peptide/nickel transport system substrate-binding protein
MRNRARTLALLRALAVAIALLVEVSCAKQGTNADQATRTVAHFDIAADPLSLNPLFAHSDAAVVEQQVAHLCFEPFFDLDAQGRAVPELIDAVPTVTNGGISRDGQTLTYHLRRGVLWSDGVPVSARDVLFTLHAILDPRNPVGSHEGYELIDRADAPSALTVRFHLRRAWAPAVATLFSYGTSPQYVLPEHVLAKEAPLAQAPFNAAPSACDGPFVFRSWRRGERLEYDANPRYWRGKPQIGQLDVPIVTDPSTNLTLLQSGASDFNLIAPSQQRTLATLPSILYRYVPTALIAGIAVNVTHPPLDDPRVRRAIAAAIDRQAISAKITLGRYPVTQTDRPRYSWAYDPAIAEPSFAPAVADALLDASGWRRGSDGMRRKNGSALTLTYVQFPETTTGVRVAAFVQAELRDRGIVVSIKSVSNAQLFLPAAQGGQLARGAFDLAYVPWQMGADPDDSFLLGCQAALKNYMRYCDPTIDRLEERAVREPDQAARRADYARIDAIVARDVPIIYLFNPNYIYAYRSALHGFAPNASSPTWNAYAWSLR